MTGIIKFAPNLVYIIKRNILFSIIFISPKFNKKPVGHKAQYIPFQGMPFRINYIKSWPYFFNGVWQRGSAIDESL